MEFNFTTDIILESGKVLLRPLKEDDLANLLLVALSDPNLLQYSPTAIHSEELLEKYISKAVNERRNMIRYPFAVYDKQAGQYAGSTSFCSISDPDNRLEIGWTWIGPQFQRTGLNRHCKYLMLEYAFDKLGCERVEFRTDEQNLQSRTAIEKIGGKLEGILRSHTLLYSGRRRNTAYYSILREEWKSLKPAFLVNKTT